MVMAVTVSSGSIERRTGSAGRAWKTERNAPDLFSSTRCARTSARLRSLNYFSELLLPSSTPLERTDLAAADNTLQKTHQCRSSPRCLPDVRRRRDG